MKILKGLLQYPFDDKQEADLNISLNEIIRCHKCLSNENLCWFHTETVKTILISDAQKWMEELSTLN